MAGLGVGAATGAAAAVLEGSLVIANLSSIGAHCAERNAAKDFNLSLQQLPPRASLCLLPATALVRFLAPSRLPRSPRFFRSPEPNAQATSTPVCRFRLLHVCHRRQVAIGRRHRCLPSNRTANRTCLRLPLSLQTNAGRSAPPDPESGFPCVGTHVPARCAAPAPHPAPALRVAPPTPPSAVTPCRSWAHRTGQLRWRHVAPRRWAAIPGSGDPFWVPVPPRTGVDGVDADRA